eukprot:6180757-Pleurochrysis_carterae.AAC.1
MVRTAIITKCKTKEALDPIARQVCIISRPLLLSNHSTSCSCSSVSTPQHSGRASGKGVDRGRRAHWTEPPTT